MKRPKRLSQNELWEYAVKQLASRAQAVGELRQKLLRRAEKGEDVEAVLARLKEAGALDDRKFAEYFAARRLENDNFGKWRVLAELRGRQVAGSIADQAVGEVYHGVDELELAQRFLARKFRNAAICDLTGNPKGLASLYRKLRAAGFSHRVILESLKAHLKSGEQLEAFEAYESEGSADP
ncbi:MAG: recombination regulator RecX [Bryobacteraceae bacterium]|nr:recombination regulator RecX [Bryobacteraceae bacterium]MDW8377387.1 regulatory protein RecX [Bryobacterales bacterium]